MATPTNCKPSLKIYIYAYLPDAYQGGLVVYWFRLWRVWGGGVRVVQGLGLQRNIPSPPNKNKKSSLQQTKTKGCAEIYWQTRCAIRDTRKGRASDTPFWAVGHVATT